MTGKAAAAAAAAAPSVSMPDLPDLTSVDPLLVGGVVGILALAGGAVSLLSGPKGPQVKPATAKTAYAALQSDEAVRLIDIRTATQVREQGSPDLRSIKKSALTVSYSKTDRAGTTIANANYGTTVLKKVTDFDTPVILLDADGTEGAQAARELLTAGYTKVFYVQGGAEAWKETEGLPWKAPSKGLDLSALSLSLPDISGVVDDFKADPTMTKGALAIGAIVGTSALAVAEIDVLLQLVGVFAVGQFLFRLINADERESTIKGISSFVSDKIAPGELPKDLSTVAKTLLEVEVPTGSAEPAARVAKVSSSDADVPENVASAREWIGKWRASVRGQY